MQTKNENTTDTDDRSQPSIVYAEEIFEPCDQSPVGQCQYTAEDGFRNCIHCGKGDGV